MALADEDKPLSELALNVEDCFGVEFGRHRSLNVFCPFCEVEGESRSMSCSVSSDGLFNCKSCKKTGTAEQFAEAKAKGSKKSKANGEVKFKASASNQHLIPPISEKLVEKDHKMLMRSTVPMAYLTVTRGLKLDTIRRYELGHDDQRITIPIRDSEGVLVQLRRYMPGATQSPKMISHLGGDGSPHFYPAEVVDECRRSTDRYFFLQEGEFDTLLQRQEKLLAGTFTTGVSSWCDEFTELIRHISVDLKKIIVITYDVNDSDDDLGQRVAFERAVILTEAGCKCKILRLPLPDKYIGGDITNWYVHEKRTAKELVDLANELPLFTVEDAARLADEAQPRIEPDTAIEPPLVTLHEATQSKYFYKPIRMRCMVAGKTMSPYIVPSDINVDIQDDEGNISTVNRKFDANDGFLLNLIECTESTQKRFIKGLLGLPQHTPISIEVVKTINLEKIYLIPTIDENRHQQGPYVLRECFYVGHGLETNRVYNFEGYTLPEPTTQAATHIFTNATLAETDLESWSNDPALVDQLRNTFHSQDVFSKFEDIAEQMSAHITKIYGRADLHNAVDLVFHSPLSFDFNGTRIRKGWLEALILGDTRTGKGFVAEGLSRHYGLGEVISAENLSHPGLVGGIAKVGDRLTLVWGKLPINDRRMVIMDECSSMNTEMISRLSRIRSEGIAEVNKIITERTNARTRLLWLANNRPGSGTKPKVLSDYTFGVEAVSELMGAAEDVARLDFALLVTQNEVKSNIINKQQDTEKKPLQYTSELCRSLIVWAWSRQPEHIRFSDAAVEFVFKAAQELGKRFSARICLIQSEDVRYKIARIAVAAACRTFSSSDGVHVEVGEEHVQYAYNFICHIYSKPGCAYAQMSQSEREQSTMRSAKKVYEVLDTMGPEGMFHLVHGLLELQKIGLTDIQDFLGVEFFEARNIISELVRLRALVKEDHYYVKKPAFRQMLISLKQQLSQGEGHVTITDDDTGIDDATEENQNGAESTDTSTAG